ncbi:long-chain-fatty-acid--CoA ligase [Gammaproteobacteria bacterium]
MEEIWFNSYPKNIPHEINPDKYSSLVEMFAASCCKFFDRPALSGFDHTMTYSELSACARAFAAYLQNKLELKKGDRIALMLPNVMQYHVAFFGALQAGLVIVNINPLYTARELIVQLNDSQAESIVVLTNFASVLQHALPETGVKNVIVTEVGDLYGFFKRQIINFISRRDVKKSPLWDIPNTHSFYRVLSIGKKCTLIPVPIKNSDIALLQYTGGTTGVSKAAILTHRNLLANIEQCSAWIGGALVPGYETSITVLPLYHIFSLTVCCLFFTNFGALQVLVANPRDLSQLIKKITDHPISIFVGLTTLFNQLVNISEFCCLDFSKLKITVAGGMAMNSAVAEKWYRVTGSIVLEGYGLTEAGPVVSMSPLTQQEFLNSLGLPLPSTEVSIRDKEGGEVATGEAGELWVRGPQVMRSYWQRSDETEKVLTQDGWLKTGDIVVMDERGYLYLIDRKKDIIVVAGYNVYPNEVESVIAGHPMVFEVAVVGDSSKYAGEVVKAFIVKKDESLTKEKIIAYCRDRLTSYKIPKRIEFVTVLPKSNVGKVLRRVLKEF